MADQEPIALDAATGEPIYEEQARIENPDGSVYLVPNYPEPEPEPEPDEGA